MHGGSVPAAEQAVAGVEDAGMPPQHAVIRAARRWIQRAKSRRSTVAPHPAAQPGLTSPSPQPSVAPGASPSPSRRSLSFAQRPSSRRSVGQVVVALALEIEKWQHAHPQGTEAALVQHAALWLESTMSEGDPLRAVVGGLHNALRAEQPTAAELTTCMAAIQAAMDQGLPVSHPVIMAACSAVLKDMRVLGNSSRRAMSVVAH